MKKSLIIIALISFFSFSYTTSNDWKLYKSIDGVKIFSKVESTQIGNFNRNMLVFKYVNTTKKALNLKWKLNLYYGGVCRGCSLPSPNEYEMTLNLAAYETKTGNAKSDSKIFSFFYNSPNEELTPLDKFEFEGLKVFIK